MHTTTSTKKRKTTQGDASTQATRERILNAALIEFSALGFKGASLRAIGKRAAVDFTLITYYFGNKTNLWKEVLTRGFGLHGLLVEEILSSEPCHTPGQNLRLRMRAEFLFACSKNSMFRMINNEFQAQQSERLDWINQHFLQQSKTEITKLIKNAQASGELIDGNPKLLYQMLQIGVRAILFGENKPGLSDSTLTQELPELDEHVTAQYWQLIDTVFFPQVAH